MPEETDPSDRLRLRIREGLDKLPLTGEQKAAVIPQLLDDARFLDSDGGERDGGKLREDSRFFDFEPKIRGLVLLCQLNLGSRKT